MKYLLPFLCSLILSASTYGQKCLTDIKVQESIDQDPEVLTRMEQYRLGVQEYIQKARNKTTSLHYVSVVVHVLYATTTENIPDGQAQSGVYVLTQAFSMANPDIGTVPTAFKNLIGNPEVHFCLASVDPWGLPTTGITRTEITGNMKVETDYYNPAKGGVAAWDPKRYLNIWVVDLPNGLLGFAYPPGAAPSPSADGIVVDYRCMGNNGTAQYNTPHHLGKTLVHEAGHYFGLQHIWGKNTGCSSDDGVPDTPPQNAQTYGCPTFPKTDNCSVDSNGIMFMNFMDYSDDACLLMFTNGQKNVIKGAFFSGRQTLGSPTLCYPASVSDMKYLPYKLYPNPASDKLTIETTSYIESVEVLNMVGQKVITKSYRDKKVELDISSLPKGVYTLRINNDHIERVVKK